MPLVKEGLTPARALRGFSKEGDLKWGSVLMPVFNPFFYAA
jgi:hypothetical protein